MSIKLMASAWELDIPSTEKMVLLCLCDHSNEAGVCWPSVATIARKSSKSHRTVQVAIQWLRHEGYCSWDDTPGKPHCFTLDPRKICTPTPADSAPRRNCAPQELQQTPAKSAPKPIRTIIPSEANASSGRARFIAPPDVSDEQWEAFRAQRKKPFNSRSYLLICTKLLKLAEDGWPPGDLIDLATERGWETVFAPRDQGHGRSANNVTSLRGARPDPALDLYRGARDAEDRENNRGAGASLPALGSGGP